MSGSTQTVLVTGAAGFIGSHTVDRLLSAGHTVIGVDNFRTGRRENLAGATESRRFRLEAMDVLDEVGFSRLLSEMRPDAVIHLAALVSVPESIRLPEENFRLNVLATERVANCARKHRVDRIVFSSSAAVYGVDSMEPIDEDALCSPRSPYGAAKLASEAMLLSYARTFGVMVRCQRYFNVFGPRQDPTSPYSGVISLFASGGIADRELTMYGDGEQTRDFIAVVDVAEANVLAATRPGLSSGVANICTGRSTSLNSLIESLERLTGKTLILRRSEVRTGDIRHSVGKVDRARRDLGFESRTTFEKGLADYLAALKREKAAAT